VYNTQISDVAFVGGTLVNIGGHSLLEPLFFRKTPIFGKYLQNVKDISKEILKRNIGFKVENSKDILKSIEVIENHTVENKEIEDFFNENRNVALKILQEIDKIIK
jgi:tRNA (guanine-N7-)-methyltransferase